MILSSEFLDRQIYIGMYYLVTFLYFIFTNSNILLCVILFLLANRLIGASKKFEFKQENLKIRMKNIDLKIKLGVYILGLFSVFSLFKITQFLLLICFDLLPNSLFLDIISTLGIYGASHNSINSVQELTSLMLKEQFVLLIVSFISLLTFLIALLGLYHALFKKIVLNDKTKGHIYFIIFILVSFFFGLPLMLKFMWILTGETIIIVGIF
ncbi:MAG: hypothetical protein ACFFBP_06720 [Promethearchaeota archaeon]